MKNLVLKVTVFVLVIFIIVNNLIFYPANIFSWDVFGYYLYLPLKFIYNDLGLHNESIIHAIIDKYNNTSSFYQAIKMPDGVFVLKYTMGLSIFYFPFFLIGHLIAILFNYTADGFSTPYQYSVFAGGIIYTILGIIVLSKVLLRFFSEKITAVILLLIVFSTNYIVSITMYGQNAMSHSYLFLMYSLILWLTILWHNSNKLKYIIFLALVSGVAILSRPSEIVCLLIPLLWGVYNKQSFEEKFYMLLKQKKQIFIFTLIVLLIGSSQLIYWKIYAGKFLYNSYGANAGEGFEFLSPYILQVLFSFRKGWLIYTPVMIFAVSGFYFIYRQNRTIFYPLSAYFIFNLYIVSSWSCWWYAQSFSQRALISSYPVMAIGLGCFLTWLFRQKIFLKWTGITLIIGFVLLNIFQSWQLHNGVLDGDRMTKDYYFAIFGKMHATAADKRLLLVQRSFEGPEKFNNENEYNSRLLKKMDFENSDNRDSTLAYSGKYSFKLDSSVIYSPSVEAPYYELTQKDHAWVRVSAYIYPPEDIQANPFSLVIHFTHKGYAYKYTTYDSEKMKLEPGKWNKISFDYLTPEVRRASDNLKVYFWMRGKEPVYIDDLQVDIFDKK
jgi:hypothetical protein